MRVFACRVWGSASRSTGRRWASATTGESGNQEKLWEKLTYFVAFPAVGLGMLNVYLDKEEHKRPEFIPYDYLRIRNKKFPWGDGNHSLFHNPHTNALPEGYEDEH